eukprot:jgi/Botrbrau1/9450/Bobra.0252s0071.1
MVRHNNVVPNQHFKKKWQFYVKTWFNQPRPEIEEDGMRGKRRRQEFPRSWRPQSGSLWTTGAGTAPWKVSQENANRLKAFKASLVVYPRRKGVVKAGDADAETLAKAAQAEGPLLPIGKLESKLEFRYSHTGAEGCEGLRCSSFGPDQRKVGWKARETGCRSRGRGKECGQVFGCLHCLGCVHVETMLQHRLGFLHVERRPQHGCALLGLPVSDQAMALEAVSLL